MRERELRLELEFLSSIKRPILTYGTERERERERERDPPLPMICSHHYNLLEYFRILLCIACRTRRQQLTRKNVSIFTDDACLKYMPFCSRNILVALETFLPIQTSLGIQENLTDKEKHRCNDSMCGKATFINENAKNSYTWFWTDWCGYIRAGCATHHG